MALSNLIGVTSMSESPVRVTMLSLLAHPYFELDSEQDAIDKFRTLHPF